MSFLIGDFSNIRLGTKGVDFVKFKFEINKKDLLKARECTDYQIIDISNRKFYGPEENAWVDIPTK